MKLSGQKPFSVLHSVNESTIHLFKHKVQLVGFVEKKKKRKIGGWKWACGGDKYVDGAEGDRGGWSWRQGWCDGGRGRERCPVNW